MYICTTTRLNVSPSQLEEILNKIVRILTDFLGTLDEETLRKNFFLAYELVDEMVHHGYPQMMSTGDVN
jgi:AP-4 complex subunit mu-1